MLTAIENAKKLVITPEWPRTIDNFPKDSDSNCWGFALDGMKIPALQELHYYSNLDELENEIFGFLEKIGLTPRKLSKPEEKSSNEMVFLFYIFTYFDIRIEDFRGECHVSRIECDGTVVEKADATEEPVITSLEEIKQRLFNERKVSVDPILIAVRKPQ